MKGIIFNIVEDTIGEHLGEAVWEKLLADAGVDHGYTGLGNYPDEEMVALITAAAQALDRSPRQILHWVGERAVAQFVARYPQFFADYESTAAFLPTLDRIIHPEVRKLYRDARPPQFDCTSDGGAAMTVIYRSHRRLCGLAEGLMHGVAAHYGESVRIEHPECVENQDQQCRFQLYLG